MSKPVVADKFLNIIVNKKEYQINLKAADANSCGCILSQQRWYWGNVPREVIEIAMKDKPDGTFVLRDASTENDFTLTLKVRKSDRLIKIICKNGKCGFNNESLDFDHVIDLLDAHREYSLVDYNADLNISLLHPLGRVVALGKRSSKAALDDSYKRIYMAFRCHMEGIVADYERAASLFDHLFYRKVAVINGIRDRREKIKTAEHLAWILTERLKFMTEIKPKVAAWVRGNFVKTMTRFEKFIRRTKEVRKFYHEDIYEFEDLLEVIDIGLESMEPEVVSAYEACEDWKQIIADHRVGKEGVEVIAYDVSYLVSLEPIHMTECLLRIELKWDPTCWISVNSNKEQAAARILSIVEKLGDDSDGVFLIRPSASKDRCFVLTVSMNRRVHNCLIFYQDEPRPGEDEAAGFAFMDTPNYFPTLVDFVRFYSMYSLKEHNEFLDTKLKHPAFPGNNVLKFI